MRAGQTIMMVFPGDSQPYPVPRELAAKARADGAKFYGPSNNVPALTEAENAKFRQQGMSAGLPVAGAIGGSMAGGAAGAALGALGGPAAPVTVPLGAFAGRQVGGILGGMAGQGAREGFYRAKGFGDAPGSIGEEAKAQAVWGPVGEAIGAPLQLAGRGIIRSGLPARLQDEWKAVAEMVKERLPVGGANLGPIKSGGKRAGENLAKKTAARDAVNRAAGAAGVEIKSGPMETKMLAMLDSYGLRGDRSAQISALSRRMDDFLETWKAGKLSPEDAQVYLSSLDEEARNLWKAEKKMGQHVPEAERRAAQQAKQIAGELRNEFRRLVPGHRRASAALSNAVAAKGAIDESEHMGVLSLGSRLATGAMLGAGVEQFGDSHRDPAGYLTKAGTGLLLAHPSLSSRVGLSMAGGALGKAATQAPRALGNPEPLLEFLRQRLGQKGQ